MFCHGVGAAALWTTQPSGKESCTRESPGEDSDWLSSELVPIPGPITVAHWGHTANLWPGGGVFPRKERKDAEQTGAAGAPGPALLQPWKQTRNWVQAGNLSVAWWLQSRSSTPERRSHAAFPGPRLSGFSFLVTGIYFKDHFEK